MPSQVAYLPSVVQEQPLTTGTYFTHSEVAMCYEHDYDSNGVLLKYHQPGYLRPKTATGVAVEGGYGLVSGQVTAKHEKVYTSLFSGEIYDEYDELTAQGGAFGVGLEKNFTTGEWEPYYGGSAFGFDVELKPGGLSGGVNFNGKVEEIGADWRMSENVFFVTSYGYLRSIGLEAFGNLYADGMILEGYAMSEGSVGSLYDWLYLRGLEFRYVNHEE